MMNPSSRLLDRRALLTRATAAAGVLALGCGDRATTAGSSPTQDDPGGSREPTLTRDATPVPAPTGEPSATVQPASAAAFPLEASPNGRYLVDQLARPFRIHGDTAWSMIANLTYAEAELYLADRASRGINTVLVNLLERRFAVNAPANRRGDQPFTTPGDFARPNEAYFAFADSVLDLAAGHGMLVLLCYLYAGYAGGPEGWYEDMLAPRNTRQVCFDFGRYLGARYRDRPNIAWVAGGDFAPPDGSEGQSRMLRVLEGIRDAGAAQLATGHWAPHSLSSEEGPFAPHLGLNAVYTYGPGNNGLTQGKAREGYAVTPPLPAFLFESGYEAEGWVDGSPQSVRERLYWAVLSGATAGAISGHRDIWPFQTASWGSGYAFGQQPWQQSLDSPGARDMRYMGELFAALPWHELAPAGIAGTPTLITKGGGSPGSHDYVAAALAKDRLLVAYLPPAGSSSRAIAVNTSLVGAKVAARWFDPTTGAFTAAPRATNGDYTAPGRNGSGANDWVLVVEPAPAAGADLRPSARLLSLARD